MRKKSRTRAASHRRKTLHRLVRWSLAVFVLACIYFFYGMPSFNDVRPLDTRPSIVVLANDDSVIARYGSVQGSTVTLQDLPLHVVEAVISVEDRRFYNHIGIDFIGLGRATVANLRARHFVQGGSTITQQLAKNMFLTPDKTLRRKVQEALMALRIEYKHNKNEILAAYLNRVYFGAGAYGIDAAARTYFNKTASQLTVWEGAVLAGLLKAPTRFSPATNPDLAEQRASVVIDTMQEAGYLNPREAQREKMNAYMPPAPALSSGDSSRYFTDWVIDQIDSFITTSGEDIVVKTTLDPRLQALADKKQKDIFHRMDPQDKVSQVAFISEQPDGAVVAMIGGADYRRSQFNRATQALRQTGSAFKPFVYLAALENGLSPDSEIEDAPIRDGLYRPENYDQKYFGTVTLAQALAKSMNTATIRLLQAVGVENLIDVARRAGITAEINPELGAALGTTEMLPLEVVNAYTAIANGGHAVWPYAVLSIKDSAGRLLYQRDGQDYPQVFSEDNIAALNKMLEGVVTDGTGEKARLPGVFVAGKTGTTQNYRDAWFIGYTDRLVTGVWMGNDDNSPMHRIVGGKYPAQLWHDYMAEAIHVDIPAFVPEKVEEDNAADVLPRGYSEPVYNR